MAGLTQAAEAIGKRAAKLSRGAGSFVKPSVASSAGSMMGQALMANMAIGGGIGAVYGGLTSDSHMSGAIRGGIGGLVVGAAVGEGLPAAAKFASANKQFMSTAGSFSSSVISSSKMLNTDTGRSSMWAAGGLLGSAMFRGNGRDYKRGFNMNRGSRIGA